MRHAARNVFDDFVTTGVRYWTSDAFSDLLGQYDQLSIQVVADDVDVTGTFTLAIEHSADGVHFLAKSALPEIHAQPITAGLTNLFAVADAGTNPSLTYVRLRVSVATTTRARIRVDVTMRDEGIVDLVEEPAHHHHHHHAG